MATPIAPGNFNGKGGTHNVGSGYNVRTMPMRARALTAAEQQWLGVWVEIDGRTIGQVWSLTSERDKVAVVVRSNCDDRNVLETISTDRLRRIASVRKVAEQPELFAELLAA